MGKKIVKVDGKTYVVDDSNLEEVDTKAEKKEAEKGREESKKVEKKEVDKKDLDTATDKVIEKLGLDKIKSDIDSIKKSFEEKADKKVSGLINLEKLMKKSVDEMTSREKIIGFFSALLANDVPVLKALSEGTGPDGGYLFPDEFRYEIIRDIEEKPHMRNEVRVVPMTRDIMQIPTLISGPKVTWTNELAAKSTTTARFGQATLTVHKMAAIQYISDELISDSTQINVVDLIISLFAEAIGIEEDRVITAGNGVGQPTGYASGGLGIQAVACAGNLDFDDIINLEYLLPNKYNVGAKFYVHRNNIREMRKIKDTNGRYLWQEPLAAGQPATFHGFPVVQDNNLSEAEIYFGDLKYAYWLGDRQQMSVKISQDTTEAFTKDLTAVRVVARIAGNVVEPRALKVLNGIP